tara:strand:- start:42 stop:218 length:177 start_codon:yes stop_codon:yes gene_type:complete
MDQNYSINEILDAVEELRGSGKKVKFKENYEKKEKNENSDIPKDTLKLIEQAENVKLD